MSTTALSLPLPTLSALAAASPEEGLRLAVTLSEELTRTWKLGRGEAKDPSAYLRNDSPTALDPRLLFNLQYCLIAAANNYWRT